ncbi:MAG: hypothetical protein JOZ92_05440 [Candidatus Dormibacteraeota bacterium]|nr:hypothetical protein [Candidatus Dormibacteraeota bacterium]
MQFREAFTDEVEQCATAGFTDTTSDGRSVPVRSIDPEDAGEHFGSLGAFFSLDCPASSAITQQLLGWHPVQPGLLDDLEQGGYFDPANARSV